MSDTTEMTATEALTDAADRFAEAVVASNAYREYEAASAALEKNSAAKELLSEYKRRSRYIEMASQWGGERDQDRAELERLEREMSDNAIIGRYMLSQQQLVSELREVNEFMTGELGIDLASLVRPQSCGCGS
ncbi:MAG: YlbF family regulator [Spirochaetales bacterium]